MRILIVGGGIGGLTLGGLLQQRGFRCTIAEAAEQYADIGYVLGLWPAGSKILKGLGLYPAFVEAGLEFQRYEIADGHGQVLHTCTFEDIRRDHGSIYSIHRPALIEVLRQGVDPDTLRMGTTVTDLVDLGNEIRVTFNDGSLEYYDLVVGADGIDSAVRDMTFGDVAPRYSGTTGWLFWIEQTFEMKTEVVQYLSEGKIFGAYRAQGHICAFASMQLPPDTPDSLDTRIERIRENFGSFRGHVPAILRQLSHPEQIFHGDYRDLLTERWYRGRVVLLGDAVHAVLPTTGLGASMAMESAAVLAEELCRADSRYIGRALEQYVARRRPRTARIIREGRMLHSFFTASGPMLSAFRDNSIRALPNSVIVGGWEDIMRRPI